MTQEINNECWRNISGYLNYQISNVGRVRKADTGRILKPCIEKNGYYRINLCKDTVRKHYLIHRLVAHEFIENIDNKNIVDHIDHDLSNNTTINLRWTSNSENQMNRSKQQNTSSKYKGVCFSVQHNKWLARIMLDGKRKHLGFFTNEKEAAAKYNEFALNLFGEHACLNEISSGEEDVGEEEEDS